VPVDVPKICIFCVLFPLIRIEKERIETIGSLIPLHDRDEPLLLQRQHFVHNPGESIKVPFRRSPLELRLA
jgi:hypothetical protein